MEDSGFVNLIKSKTCFKSTAWNCIDLILTNNPKGFQNTGAMKTGVSDHHALIVLFLKTTFTKMPPNKLKHKLQAIRTNPFLKNVENLSANHPFKKKAKWSNK